MEENDLISGIPQVNPSYSYRSCAFQSFIIAAVLRYAIFVVKITQENDLGVLELTEV